jgi:hypothetical protein
MPFWKKSDPHPLRDAFRGFALGAALSGIGACAMHPAALEIRNARLDAAVLHLQIDWRPSAEVQDALDHGIALDFVVQLQADTAAAVWPRRVAQRQRRLRLRYYPLSGQYQWLDLDLGLARSYPSRALALAALDDLRLPLPDWRAPAATRYRVTIALDRGGLPGALRLVALLRPTWWLASPEYTWLVAAG